LKLLSENIEEKIINLSGADVSVRMAVNDFGFAWDKRSIRYSELAVAKVDEAYDSWFCRFKFSFPKETVADRNGCAFVEQSKTFDSRNLTGVKIGLPLNVGSVSWYA